MAYEGAGSAMMRLQPPETIIRKARTSLLMSQPFFGSLAMNLKLAEDEEMESSFATDGESLFYHPEKMREYSFDEVKGVLCHEVLHCVLEHHERRGSRDPERWNIAADLAENPLVLEAGLVLPEGALIDPAYAGMSAEQIYAALPEGGGGKDGNDKGGKDGKDQQGKGGKGNPSNFGAVRDKPQNAKTSADGKSWKAIAKQAMSGAAAGTLPGGFAKMLGNLIVPPPKWQEVLRQYMTIKAKDDYSWRRPNRRFVTSGLYLPDAFSEQMGELVIAIDVSGSVNKPLLESFLGEVQALTEEITFEAIHVVQCSTKIVDEQTYQNGDRLEPEVIAGGGTKFTPVFKWIEDKGINPEVVLYFTDLCCRDFPSNSPVYDTLWIEPEKESVFRKEPPFGQCLKIA